MAFSMFKLGAALEEETCFRPRSHKHALNLVIMQLSNYNPKKENNRNMEWEQTS